MKNRHFQRWLCFVMIAAVITWGCGNHEAKTDAPSPKAVRLVAVESSTDAGGTTYSAVITPNVQVDLAFRVTGYVVDLRQTRGPDGVSRALEPGSTIDQGVTLARVRAAEFQAVVDKAHGARDESNAGITAAEAGLVEAQAALTQAESDFGRASILWQQESITKPVFDGAKAKLDSARARTDAAAAAIAAAKQSAGTAAAQAHEAEIALGDTDLRAPFDGILVERHVDVGTLVSPAMPAFTIADLRLVKARFSAPDTALRLFRAGQALPVTVGAFPDDPFLGRVLSVAPAADPKSRSFEIAVAIGNPALKLRSGMIASIRVESKAAARPQLRIPIDALVHDTVGDRYLVYALEQKSGGTVAKAISVRPGPLVGNHVSILEGLAAGQRIVASGANLLRPDDPVKEIQ
jgi:multidrug efflux pump subunit AcrA (membrane-fusion protein)